MKKNFGNEIFNLELKLPEVVLGWFFSFVTSLKSRKCPVLLIWTVRSTKVSNDNPQSRHENWLAPENTELKSFSCKFLISISKHLFLFIWNKKIQEIKLIKICFFKLKKKNQLTGIGVTSQPAKLAERFRLVTCAELWCFWLLLIVLWLQLEPLFVVGTHHLYLSALLLLKQLLSDRCC